MHQPVPHIAPRPAGATSLSVPPRAYLLRQPVVPARVKLIVMVSMLFAFMGISIPFLRPLPLPPPILDAHGHVLIDPDGDDPRYELMYHWQDPRFIADERRQIIWMVEGLALIAIYQLGKRAVRDNQVEEIKP